MSTDTLAQARTAIPRTVAKIALALVLTIAIASCGLLMVGPQILVIAPVVLLSGVVLTLRKSVWSLVCFGYPLTFGLISAWIGYKEMPGYEQSSAFAVSLGIGMVGIALIALGVGKWILAGQIVTTGRGESS